MKKLFVFLLVMSWTSCENPDAGCFECTFQTYLYEGGDYKLINIETFDTCDLKLNDVDDLEEDGSYNSGKYKYVTNCEMK
ncbi:MAG TPA: hypothetical protein PLC76_01270 [Saprospiraceae bacterium]|jgi:hypothetical protein|nr:MAG: hypothetical protein QY315_09400 [Saprospiraceae bacterium]HRP83324.1 hypothetical protein [Saprospiraceae bacterium]